MGESLSAGRLDRSSLQQIVAAARPTLVVNGIDVGAQGVAELKDGLTHQQARQRTGKDRLDQVFFEAEGRNYVAYGKGMRVPKKPKHEQPSAQFGAVPARIVEVDNEANTAREGATTGLKLIGIKTGLKVAIVGGVAGLAMLAPGRLSQAVSGSLARAKTFCHGLLEGAARRMGTSVPVAGLIIGGVVVVAEVGASALYARHRRPDYGPLQDISR